MKNYNLQTTTHFTLTAALWLFLATAGAATANAATRTVDNTSDTAALSACTAAAGDCSLRGAVSGAAAGDTIVFASPLFDTPQTIEINGEIRIDKRLTVTGKGANLLTIRNIAADSRVFFLAAGFSASLSGMTLTGGTDGSIGTGPNSSALTLTGVYITGNTRDGFGGGIIVVSNGSTLNLVNSTVSGNISTANSSDIIASAGSLNISNSTVSGNRATGSGIRAFDSTTIINSTITDNEPNGVVAGVSVTVRNSIIAGNRNNSATPDVSGAFTSGGYNLIGNVGTASGFNQTGDQTGTSAAPLNPMLAPLSNNGGTTPTHALLFGSPAIDKGNSFGAATDQRGFARPVDLATYTNATGGNGADIGAFELQLAPTAAGVTVGGRVTTSDGRGIANVLMSLTDSSGELRTARTDWSGFYSFSDVQAGATYIITATGKRHIFSQPSQVLNVNDDTTEINFVGTSEKRLRVF